MSQRIIWFQHFHKAAGSSVVAAARLNGERFWPSHINGNPTNSAGEQLTLSSYSKDQLSKFITQCKELGVTFIATEWALPQLDALKQDDSTIIVTVVRDPLARFVSNFYYDLHNGYTTARSIQTYVNSSSRTFTMDNYYCRILAKLDNRNSTVTRREFETAKETLAKFDTVVSLEHGFEPMQKALGWTTFAQHENANVSNLTTLMQRIKGGRFKSAYLQLRYPKRNEKELYSKQFESQFRSDNCWDYQLLKGLLN